MTQTMTQLMIHNDKYHSTVKMKPVDLRSNTQTDTNKENNNEGPKLMT